MENENLNELKDHARVMQDPTELKPDATTGPPDIINERTLQPDQPDQIFYNRQDGNYYRVIESKQLTPEELSKLPPDFQQNINEIVTNIPIEFEVDGKVLGIKSLSAKRMVLIDTLINKMYLIGRKDEEITEDTPVEELMELLEKRNQEIINLAFQIIFNIVNEDTKEPEFAQDWLMENLDASVGGIAERIIDAYNYKCNPGNLLKKIMGSRKF